jgi:hypothetical protein
MTPTTTTAAVVVEEFSLLIKFLLIFLAFKLSKFFKCIHFNSLTRAWVRLKKCLSINFFRTIIAAKSRDSIDKNFFLTLFLDDVNKV